MAVPYSLTEDGFENQIGTNHLSHFLFFQLLKDTLLASSTPAFHSRVINLTSAAHHFSTINFDDLNYTKGDYSPWLAYGQSKTANIYTASSIERHYGARGLHALSVHPGLVLDTELTRDMPADELAELQGNAAMMQHMVKTPAQGASTTVWAAVSPDLEGKGGWYLADLGTTRLGSSVQDAGGSTHAAHAYGEEAEEKLWKLSSELVGVAV